MTSTPTRPVDNVVITTKGLQDRNINILAGTTVENKGKLIINDPISLTESGLRNSSHLEFIYHYPQYKNNITAPYGRPT